MEIIKVKNADYARYEELLMQRDLLRKEAGILHMLYVKEFGDLYLALFTRQIACIKKKKLIGYYQRAVNLGQPIDRAAIERLLAEEMKNYAEQLQRMLEENAAAKDMEEVSQLKLLKIKRIYRRLAKQLHPDINPKTSEIPELMELWNAAVTAYNCNSLKDMEELEVLVGRAIERIGLGLTEIEIPDLAKKIEAVEAEIERIRTTDPYQYKFLLDDPEAVAGRRQDLEAQEHYYIDYEKELDAAIDELLRSGVKIIWKMN